MLIKILTKKLGLEPSNEILEIIEKTNKEKLEKLEDNVFEIVSWEEVKDIIIM